MRHLLILATFSSLLISPFWEINAQGVPGTWKRATMTVVDSKGKTTDLGKEIGLSKPCMKDITYTFAKDGHTKLYVPDVCGSLKKAIEDMNTESTWTINGHKLTETTNKLAPAVYDISFEGNKMIWIFNYADNPRTPNPTKAQRLTIVYQKI